MRYSKLVGQTLMNPPSDADSRNAELLIQAGFVRRLAAGIFSYLPLGKRVLAKIENIIREEMNAVAGQEVSMPALIPIENWQITGRDNVDISFKTVGANDREFILGWTHEEVVTPLLQEFVSSYRDLPLAVYQFQAKFRNEPRAKSGVLRGREFTMKDMYSFHTTQADLDVYYNQVKQAYFNVFKRCGLNAYIVEASGGAFTDKRSHEFAVVTDAGEDTILVYEGSEMAENLEIAKAYVGKRNPDEAEVEMGEIAVDRGLTVEANAEAHGVPAWKILKTVVYKIDEGFVGIVIRGDLNVDMDRLKKYFGAENIRTATDEELVKLELLKGYISPVNNEKIDFIGDESVASVTNYVTGANKLRTDYVGVNLARDFVLKDVSHFAELDKKMLCEFGNCEVEVYKAVEVGNIFQLDTVYTDAFGMAYNDADGVQKSVVMGCYGIGVTRLLGTIAEVCNDGNGIIWPKTVAPYQIHLLDLGNEEEVKDYATDLYTELVALGFEVLYDDRDERAGKKFNDADLIGIPVRVVVSGRNLKDGKLEIKNRAGDEVMLLNKVDTIKWLNEYYAS
ncbi:proline--tRNA ligase [Candidatus Peregrinibacteria bacterium CG11_big_fil_rev_8_21_14_0_20_41_10]|nr:MAG: proline--tRNA ligase [Candidatus Peregrinibacteria bacterium CG11_big_fil_rev_8_21_14_0_20_41_10]PJC38262.1 MAG: proline--tRNA ligase [Candidatus Peregrinibacteria bacterium CG_4_9_14_0_2_um_filter_41_14]